MKQPALFWTVLLFAVALLAAPVVHAQKEAMAGALERLTAAKKKYVDLKSYQLTVHMASYKGHLSSVPFDTATSVVYKKGDRFRSESLGITSIQDDDYMLAISIADSVIMVRDAVALRDPMPVIDPSTFGEACDRVECMEVNGRERCTLFLNVGDYEALTFEIDREGWIRRAECLYREFLYESDDAQAAQYRPKVVLDLEVPRQVGNTATRFETASYVAWVNGKPEPRDARFTLIDGRTQ